MIFYGTTEFDKNGQTTFEKYFILYLQEVLAEIQRLKEEANRFISILAEEDDPERADQLLSPGKRQSLTREVESLQASFSLFKKKQLA